MKKLLALALVVFGLAACQTEPEGINVDANGEAAVTLNVALPDDATRAAGADSALGAIGNVDLTKYDIRYILEVYDENGVLAKDRMVETSDETTAAFSFRLVPGRPYNFVVWADFVLNGKKDDLHYNTNADNKGLRKVKVIKSQWDVIDESRDAYTDVITVHNFSSASDIPTITLTRPFAKLRVVTNDIKEMISIRPAEVKVEYFNTKFRDTFDAFAETATGEYVVGALTATLLDSQKNPVDVYTGENPNETGVQTLFADYFFGAVDDRVMFTMDVKDNGGKNLPQVTFNTNIPVKRNMLTTVYGPVLTDSNNITVTIDPAFENGTNWNPGDDKYDVEIWDGKSLTEPKKDAEGNYVVNLASELAWLAAAVNGTLDDTRATVDPQTFKGKTFKLTQDINLDFNEWTPIGNSTNKFQGTFDGQDHKIANLLITGNKSYVGLFGFTTVGEIKNLVVENAKVSGRLGVGVVAGSPYTSKFNNITVQGHVEVNGMAYVGGVGGRNAYANWNNVTVNVDETSYVNANSVEDGVAYRTYVGGVTGFNGEGGHSFTNITSNIDVKGSTIDVGGLFGIAHYGNNFENCSCSGDVEIYDAAEAVDAQEIGGIAGVWHNQNDTTVTMTNCTFTGKLKANIADVDFYYGGLVGKPYSETGTGILWLNGNKCLANGIIEDESGNLVVNSLDSLEKALTTAGAAGAGDTTIVFAENTNINMTNAEWTPIKVDGYHGADIVTIEGNGAVITGLKAPLFAGGFAGGSGIVIKDLTIKDSNIVSANTIGSGAFIESVDSMAKIELTNCHLLDSTVTGGAGSRTGGLLGWTAGYSNVNDGPVKTYVTIDNCSVIGCTIQCDGSVGGINGHAGNNDWTYTTISNCTIKNNNLNSTDDGGWRVGVVVGTANVGEVTISNITESGNTLTQTGKTAPEGFKRNYYGRFVPGTTGKLTIDGEEVVMINTAEKLVAAIEDAKAGDTITIAGDITLTENVTIPAGVTFNGNGKQINGTLIAGGDIAFAGHTKVTSFSAGFSGYEITIGEGACLEITGSGRSTMGYNNTFNITGTITDAKSADKANIQPSLIMPDGISITGGNGLELNIKDAYVKIGNTTSKNSAANGTFTINIENSIAEFTNQLTFSEPTSGKNPTFNLNVKNSVLTTATKLILAAANCNMVVDNSTIDVKTNFRNSGNVELKNGSVLTGNTIQFGENGGHDGNTTVDASKFTIKASSAGHAYDGRGTGSITLKNGAEVSVDYYKDLTINSDASSTFTGTQVL